MSSVQTALEELKRKVGQEIGTADWFTVTQEDVAVFARVTGDMDPIHNDPEWARTAPPSLTGSSPSRCLVSSLANLRKTNNRCIRSAGPRYTPGRLRPNRVGV